MIRLIALAGAVIVAVAGHALPVAAAANEDALTVHSVQTDPNGTEHVRYERRYHGLRVRGGDAVAHGGVLSLPELHVDTVARVGSAEASRTAIGRFSGWVGGVGVPEKIIDATGATPRLAWETTVRGMRPDGQTPSALHVLVDAVSGVVIGEYDEVETVIGTGNTIYAGPVKLDTTPAYSLVDPSHGGNRTCDMLNGTTSCVTFTDADNIWGNGSNSSRQSAGADAHWLSAVMFDYFKNVHGRNGVNGNGSGVVSRVHYGNNYSNAFFDGTSMSYGDGPGNAKPVTVLDVGVHEITHAITSQIIPGGLNYSGEPGGLNEATSDIFATMTEFYAANTVDTPDYTLGERWGTPIRYMYNPALDGHSLSCWNSGAGGVDVHYSSGIANHFYFMLAEGSGATAYGTSPVCGTVQPVVGIGRAKAEKIWYRALAVYFTSTTSYVTSSGSNTARAATLNAAADLYGRCSTEYRAVNSAWAAVNVAGRIAC